MGDKSIQAGKWHKDTGRVQRQITPALLNKFSTNSIDSMSLNIKSFCMESDVVDKEETSVKVASAPIPWKFVIAVYICLYPILLLLAWLMWHLWATVGMIAPPLTILINVLIAVPLVVLVLLPIFKHHMSWWLVTMHDFETEATISGKG